MGSHFYAYSQITFFFKKQSGSRSVFRESHVSLTQRRMVRPCSGSFITPLERVLLIKSRFGLNAHVQAFWPLATAIVPDDLFKHSELFHLFLFSLLYCEKETSLKLNGSQ